MTATARNDKWVVPGQQDSKKTAWGAGKKKTKSKGSDVFSMMMAKNDGDSDNDDEDEEGENERDNEDSDRGQKLTFSSTPNEGAKAKENTISEHPQNSGDATHKQKNKKKNKKSRGGKKKQKDEADMSDDELLEMAAAANAARQKREMEQKEVSHPAVAFIKDYLIPFVLGFIAFLVSLLIGKPKQKQKKH